MSRPALRWVAWSGVVTAAAWLVAYYLCSEHWIIVGAALWLFNLVGCVENTWRWRD